MADEDLIARLRQGVDVWNKWRENNPVIELDLSEAKLGGMALPRVNFNRVNLNRADLGGAELFGANLFGANLREANLSGGRLFRAELSWAELSGANLFGANLSEVDLSNAALIRTNLSGANLSGANLSKAVLWESIFSDTNLTNAKGLDLCDHRGPSTIDHRTLLKSGKLPLEFLRGCGLPDTLINYLPSLLNEPIQFYSCFISYSSKDEEFAKRLHADLQDKGVRCWFAPEDLKIGDKFRVRIDETIRIYDKLLLVLSKHSIESDWVEKEVETALEKEREQKRTVLFPIRLDDTVMEIMTGWAADVRRTRHIGDFTRWKEHDEYQKAFTRLLRDLKEENAKK